MKLLVTVGAIALCLIAGSVQAADKTYDWSGIYGGASIGYVHGKQDWKLQGSQFWNIPFSTDGKKGFTFGQFDVGAHIGAQYQWRWLIIGGEVGLYKGPYEKDARPSPYYLATDEWAADIYLIAQGTAKVGFAYKRLLGYVKGGYAGAMVETRTRYDISTAITRDERTHEWHNGWTVGGGIEYALTNHVIIGAEYNYIDLGSKTHTYEPAVPGNTFNAKVDATMHQALFRLSFKF